MDYKNTVLIPRASLHCHSEFSNTKNLDCIIKIKDLIKTTSEMGFKGIAITDHECLSAHIKALEIEKQIQKTNPEFKICLGNEIYLIKERQTEEKQQYYHFILIAKDKIGHNYLRQLSSRAWLNNYWERGQNRTATLYSDFSEIVKEKGHLIGSTACLGGYLPVLITQYLKTQDYHYKELIDDFVQWCVNIFGKDDFYFELQAALTKEQIAVNKTLYKLGQFYGIKCILTDDAHYLHKEDRPIHEAFLSSREAERELAEFYEATYFKTDEDNAERLSYLPSEFIAEMYQNSMEILNKVEHFELTHDIIVPERKLDNPHLLGIFEPYYDKYKYINLFAHSQYQQDIFLLNQVEQGFINKKQEYNETNLKRIDTELQTLWLVSEKLNQRLSAYYNLTQEVIDLMWDENYGNSLVGVSRGSASGFYICYLMGIVQMNPIEWDLCEWRHLSESRPELPDIDTDSEHGKRPQIIEGFKRYYGEDRVLNIISFKTEASKSAILTAARGLGISTDEAHEIADMVPVHRGKAYTISECLYGDNEEKEAVKGFERLITSYPNLLETALSIEGIVSGVSSHASGLYIFNQPYVEQNSLMRTPNGLPVTCWDMHDSDSAGALKIDILTIENLDMIRTTLDLLIKGNEIQKQSTLHETYNKYLHPDVIDYDTKEMWDMLGNGKAINIFQLSTDVGQQACKLIKPHSLKETALVNSLMRLSGNEGELPLQKYKRFLDNIQLWYDEMQEAGLNEEEVHILEEHLLQNSGIAAEQEDVMLLAQDPKIANFTLAEANKLRKGIAKKSASVLEECKTMFFNKGREAGTREEMLKYVWDKQISLSLGLTE